MLRLDVELLKVVKDKDLVIWFCHKPRKERQNSKRTIAAELHRKDETNITEARSVNIDETNFVADAVEREMIANDVRRFNVSTAVYGVTEFKGTLHFLCSDPNSLRVYTNDSFELCQEIAVNEVLLPSDVLANPIGNCLLVTDQSNSCVWRVDGDTYALRRWSSAFEPFSMSVTCAGDVLMPKMAHPCSVEIYDLSASVRHRCRLPDDFIDVQHAVESSNGNIVVSVLSKELNSWTICEVTLTADVVRCFCTTDPCQKLDSPRRLALDAGDRVLVADYRNGRVVLLDSQLNWNKVLLNKNNDGIEDPTRIFVSSDGRRLILAQSLGSLKAIVNLFTLSHH